MAKSKGDQHENANSSKIHYRVTIDCPSCPTNAPDRSRKRKLQGETANNKPPSWTNHLISNIGGTRENHMVSTQYKTIRDHYKHQHSSTGRYPVSETEFKANMGCIPKNRKQLATDAERAENKKQSDARYLEHKRQARAMEVRDDALPAGNSAVNRQHWVQLFVIQL